MKKEWIEDCFVSVIVVPQDTDDQLGRFVADVSALLKKHYANYELIIVDNGLTRKQLESALVTLKQYSCIRIIRLSQKETSEVAIFAGLEASIGDYVVSLIPGYDPVGIITGLVTELRAGNDILFGVSKTRIKRRFSSRLGTHLFYWYSAKFLKLPIPRDSTYMVAMNRRTINALTRVKGRYRHIRQLARQIGFKSSLFVYLPRGAEDKTKQRSLPESTNLAIEIAITYSRHPLRFLSWLGLLAGIINLLYAIYVASTFVLDKNVAPGWTTLSLEMAFMFFFVFVILTIMAEYVGRTLEEVRSQPSYNIMEELTSTVLIADETRRNITK